MSADWTPDDEELLRQALREEASRIVPDSDALSRIRERTWHAPWWRRPITWTLAVATVTAAATVAFVVLELGVSLPGGDRTGSVAGEGTDDDAPEEVAADAPEVTEDVSEAEIDDPGVISAPRYDGPTLLPDDPPEADATQIATVAAYYLADTPLGPRLAREFREVELAGSVSEAALAAMAAEPLDPDYRTPWDPDARFIVTETPELITVDVTLPLDGQPVPDDLGELAVQQLVYTLQGALQRTDPVRILRDGEPADDLWGVDVSDGVARAPQLDVRQLVQINNPTEGQSKTSPVEISGEAALFEATYEWRVEQDGDVVADGFGESEEGQKFAEFSFEVELEPGDYEVFVEASDPSGGEGGGPMSDSRAFTVPPSG
jgi:hypothetical protein